MTAETEAVGHHGVDARFSGDVRDVVEVAAFTGVFEIDRRRKHAVVNRQGRDDELDPAGGPSVWPSWLLVLEICSFDAWLPKTCFIARVSARSPSGVLVP